MSPLDCCGDGMYLTAGHYYILDSLAVVPEQPVIIKRASSVEGCGMSIHPFSLQTEHGEFRWAVEVIDHLIPRVRTIKGYSMVAAPRDVVVTEQISFTVLDGWGSPTAKRLPVAPRW